MITPQIDVGITNVYETKIIPSKTYKMNLERIAGFVDEKEAVKQAIFHILMVERYSCAIYDSNYGVEFEQYIGQNIDFLRATIEQTLREALTYDKRILDVLVTNIEQLSIDTVKIDFIATCVFGDLQMEVEINV